MALRRVEVLLNQEAMLFQKNMEWWCHFLGRTGLLLDEQLTLLPESKFMLRLDVDMDVHADGLPNTVKEPDPPF